MKWLAAVLLLTGMALAQELPDTPSATVEQTCQNGKPFQKGKLGTLVGNCPFDKQVREKWDGTPDGFFKFGNGRRALHPDKKSWAIFVASHAAAFGAMTFACRNSATSGEHFGSEAPALAALTGLDFLLFKTVSPSLSVYGSSYGIVKYTRAGLK